MKLVIGSDHGGLTQKKKIISLLSKKGYQIRDVGCHSEDSCDYPDYAKKVALIVSRHQAERGILVCGTGIGMAITANKFPGVRAAVCWNSTTAALASEHNKANILCISGRFLPFSTVSKMVQVWLETPFAGGRHSRRIQKIRRFESR